MWADFNRQEIERRRVYNQDRSAACKAGGFRDNGPLHENYGLPCITGFFYWDDGTVTATTNCWFCGRAA